MFKKGEINSNTEQSTIGKLQKVFYVCCAGVLGRTGALSFDDWAVTADPATYSGRALTFTQFPFPPM